MVLNYQNRAHILNFIKIQESDDMSKVEWPGYECKTPHTLRHADSRGPPYCICNIGEAKCLKVKQYWELIDSSQSKE